MVRRSFFNCDLTCAVNDDKIYIFYDKNRLFVHIYMLYNMVVRILSTRRCFMTNKVSIGKDIYKTSRILYIIEAALEYFVSLLVAGSYLAKLTTSIGLSDAVTGILSSLVSLGFGFQLLAVLFIGNKKVKSRVSILHTVNQLMFASVYLVPLIDVPQGFKTALFMVLLVGGHAINNIVNSPKINWFMSLVDDDKRGRFTANKEIISLLGGMCFSFAMGSVIDYFEAQGKENEAFIVCGLTLLALAILHTCTLIFSKEKPIDEKAASISNKQIFSELLKDKKYLRVVLLTTIWGVAHYATVPFYGTYTIKELGFSMTFIAVLSAVSSISRALFSRPLGKLGDKRTFAKMLLLAYGIKCLSFAVNTFTVPENGVFFYAAYSILSAITFAGINSGEMNLVFESVSHEKRVCALALKNTIAGLAGFCTTLVVSRLVEHIQNSGNTFLGMHVYAQQVVSFIGALLVAVVLAYLYFGIIKRSQKEQVA